MEGKAGFFLLAQVSFPKLQIPFRDSSDSSPWLKADENSIDLCT